jgi:hypothetical protein
MHVSFITTINLDTLEDLPSVAQEISDDLTQSGFDVISVDPWARPSLQAQPVVTPLSQPTQTQQTQQDNQVI